ncbi:MAG: hypothetical protein ACN4GW_20695 [Desulforhopalus sp.]
MMWLEVIHIRVTDHECDRVLPVFTSLLKEIHEEESCKKAKFFRRALLKNDVCLHLYHESENAGIEGSPVGLRLATIIKSFGMVNHTVWTENE